MSAHKYQFLFFVLLFCRWRVLIIIITWRLLPATLVRCRHLGAQRKHVAINHSVHSHQKTKAQKHQILFFLFHWNLHKNTFHCNTTSTAETTISMVVSRESFPWCYSNVPVLLPGILLSCCFTCQHSTIITSYPLHVDLQISQHHQPPFIISVEITDWCNICSLCASLHHSSSLSTTKIRGLLSTLARMTDRIIWLSVHHFLEEDDGNGSKLLCTDWWQSKDKEDTQ